MTKPKTPALRGVQDIRTHTGRVSAMNEPYRAFMRISCLEMEKARKTKERDNALHKVELIEKRFREIEAEEAELLAAHGHVANSGAAQTPGGASPDRAEDKATAFKVRY